MHELRQLGWLPLVLFLTIPSIRWAFVNNMLENTLTALTTFAVYFVLLSADVEGRAWSPRRLLYLAAAATAIAAAVMTKGPVGLFPLISPGCIWLAGQKLRLLDAILAMFVVVSGDGSPARTDPCLPGGASLCGTLCFQSGDGEPFRRAGQTEIR